MPQQRFNHLHERLLYNWIGHDIEGWPKSLSDEEYALKYLDHLRGSLDPKKGLWLTGDTASLIDGYTPESPIPMVCLTELSLKDCLAHSTRYGKMGLGFTKKFVLQNGGQPVAYIRDRRTSPFVMHLRHLLTKEEGLSTQARKRLEILACYLKNMEKEKRQATPKATQSSKTKKVATKRVFDPYKRQTGAILHYLEEAEWRIVAREETITNRSRFVDNGKDSLPRYYLPYEPGLDLTMVIFPNNRIFSMAMRDPDIVRRLFPDDRPPVNLVSLEDIKRL